MPHHKDSNVNSDWPEVSFINGYAMFIAFLRMGVRGLNVLVFTWTTVVLLGGFVSDLGMKDFWCLTAITFIQIFSAGVFDFLLNGKSSFTKNSWKILLKTVSTMAKDIFRSIKKRREMVHGKTTVLHYFVWVVQLLVLVFVLFPVVVVYLAGLYISAVIALWRLIQHDYGKSDGGENLTKPALVEGSDLQKPALVILYSLAVAQGVFHGYKALYARVNGIGLVDEVADSYSMDRNLVSAYRNDTMMGCTKDPMFTRERNLVTYAVGLLMEPTSSDSYLSGVKILGTVLKKHFKGDDTVSGQAKLIKEQLTKSASSSGHMIRRLVETMGTESSESREIREHAARIVAHVAHCITLRYFPGGIKLLSFLLTTVENYRGLSGKHPDRGRRWQHSGARGLRIRNLRGRLPERQQRATLDRTRTSEWPESGGIWLVVQALHIIKNLAAGVDNCRILVRTEGVITKISAPLISEQLHIHSEDHDEWSSIAELSLELMSRLVAATGDTGAKLRRDILSKHKVIAIRTLRGIIDCEECELSVKIQAVEIFLLHLPEDISPSITDSGSSSRIFIWILLIVFLRADDCFDRSCGSTHWTQQSSEDIRRLADQNLQATQKSVSAIVDELSTALVDEGNISIRVLVAKILEHLIDHTKVDEHHKVKNAMLHVMPKVLREILGYGSTREVIEDMGGATDVQPSLQDIDLELGRISKGNAQENTSLSRQQTGEPPESRKLQEALISLCWTISREWYGKADPNMTRQLDEIAEEICPAEQGKCAKPFRGLVAKAEKLFEKTEAEESASVRTKSSGQT